MPEFAWYEALYDSPEEAQARYRSDQAAASSSPSLPYADGSYNDPRSNGRGH